MVTPLQGDIVWKMEKLNPMSPKKDGSAEAYLHEIGKTPDASGSSVPAWPTFFSPKARLTFDTQAKDVMPAGLYTFITPSIFVFHQSTFLYILQKTVRIQGNKPNLPLFCVRLR